MGHRPLGAVIIAATVAASCLAADQPDFEGTIQEILRQPNKLESICRDQGVLLSELMVASLQDGRAELVGYLLRFNRTYDLRGRVEGKGQGGEVMVSYFISTSDDTVRAEFDFLRSDDRWMLYSVVLGGH